MKNKRNYFPISSNSIGGKYNYKINILVVFISLLYLVGLIPSNLLAQPLAEGQNKFLGSGMSKIHSNFTKYWNQATPGNEGKWGSVENSQDNYNWAPLDVIYNFAKSNSLLYKHHTLVWGNQQPNWIASLDSAAQREQVEEWIRLVGERYPDMDYVDVVNEPLNAPPSYMNALGGSGKTGWDWVVTSFELARQYCGPDVKLILNEYNVLHSNTVTNNYIELIDTLKSRDLIDGIGIQGHYFEFKSPEGGSPSYTYSISTIKNNLNRIAALDLPVYITEFDINEENDDTQLENYRTYFPIFWEHPDVKGITLWGYVQYDVWKENAYLVTERHVERPAMEWLTSYLKSPPRPLSISPSGGVNIPRNPILIWSSSASATSYNVQLSNDFSFANLLIDTTVTDTSLQIDTLNSNSRFYWRVNASNEEGTSEYSSSIGFVTGEIITDVKELDVSPTEFALFQNYPNPFNPSTTIEFSIPQKSNVSLVVYDALGSVVMKLIQGEHSTGVHKVNFNSSNLSSGIYFYRIQAGSFNESRKMILIK